MSKEQGMIEEMKGNIEKFAGSDISDQVIQAFKKITAKSSKSELAACVKNAITLLDELVNDKTRNTIMEQCGYNCSSVNQRVIDAAKKRCAKYAGFDDFLQAELKKPAKGTKLEKIGNILYQYYTPGEFNRPMRCYCGLLRGLPNDEIVSITYCQCSRTFVKRYWEELSGKPVEVKVLESAISGAKQCKFEIRW